jgi:hypothetical protein
MADRRMTRMLLGAMLALGLILCSTRPEALASGALIETTAPLPDRSEESVKAAVMAAIDRAVRGAAAMGYAWFQLRDAQLSEDEVTVQILATEDEPDSANEVDPGKPGGDDKDAKRAPVPDTQIAPGPRTPI